MLRVCAWLCTKGYMHHRQCLYKRWLIGGPSKPRLTGKTCEDAQCSRSYSPEQHLRSPGGLRGPGDSDYPIRAFPLWRQLVGILGRLNAPKDKVAFLKASGMNLAAMVEAQGLLVACCSHSRPKTIFLKERCIVLPQSLLLKLVISEHSR